MFAHKFNDGKRTGGPSTRLSAYFFVRLPRKGKDTERTANVNLLTAQKGKMGGQMVIMKCFQSTLERTEGDVGGWLDNAKVNGIKFIYNYDMGWQSATTPTPHSQ